MVVVVVCLFVFLTSQPFCFYFHSTVAGFSLRVFEVPWSYTTRQRQDSSGRVIKPSQRPLPDKKQHPQQTNIQPPVRFFLSILYFMSFVYIDGNLPTVSHHKWWFDSTPRSVTLVCVMCSRAALLLVLSIRPSSIPCFIVCIKDVEVPARGAACGWVVCVPPSSF